MKPRVEPIALGFPLWYLGLLYSAAEPQVGGEENLMALRCLVMPAVAIGVAFALNDEGIFLQLTEPALHRIERARQLNF